jgi:HK97 family phage portal protein
VFNREIVTREHESVDSSGEVELSTFDEENITRIHGAKLERLWKKANPTMNGNDLVRDLVSYMFLTGNGMLEVVRDGNGSPSELYVIDPRRMTPIPDPKIKIRGWEYRVNNKTIFLNKEDVIHIPFFHPSNNFWGYPPSKTAKRRVLTDEKAVLFRERFFDNNALVSGVLETEQELTDPQYKRIEKFWRQTYSGVRNSHKVAILEGGLKFKAISQKAQEMEYNAGREFLRDEIFAIYGMYPAVVGLTRGLGKGEIELQYQIYYQETIMPIMKLVASKINEFFFGDIRFNSKKNTKFAIFDFGDVPALKGDIEAESRMAARYVDRGIMKINEARADFLNKPSVQWQRLWSPNEDLDEEGNPTAPGGDGTRPGEEPDRGPGEDPEIDLGQGDGRGSL